ncbi:hypothetical protein Tco_1232495 [Tanacetum coccineum]
MEVETNATTSSPSFTTLAEGAVNAGGRQGEREQQPITPMNPTSNITSNNPTPFMTPVHVDTQAVDEVFILANYSQLEPLMRKRMRQLRLHGIATRLDYSSEDVDEEMELEALPSFRTRPSGGGKNQSLEIYHHCSWIKHTLGYMQRKPLWKDDLSPSWMDASEKSLQEESHRKA